MKVIEEKYLQPYTTMPNGDLIAVAALPRRPYYDCPVTKLRSTIVVEVSDVRLFATVDAIPGVDYNPEFVRLTLRDSIMNVIRHRLFL